MSSAPDLLTKPAGRIPVKRFLFLGLFFTAAPFWAPHIQKMGENIFFENAAPFVWFGVSLLAALIFYRIFPAASLGLSEKIILFLVPRIKVLGILFSMFLVLGLYAFNQRVLHGFMGSADEHSCYFFAECLRLGKWWVKPHPLSEFFNVVHVGNRDGKWFSVYPPGWPLLMAAGLQLGIVDWLNPVLSALSLIFFFKIGEKVYGRPAAVLGIFLTALAPFFIFTSAAYFSHPACLFAVSLFIWAYLQWTEEKNPSRKRFWISLCAVAAGYGFATRYLTMYALFVPFASYRIFRLVRREEKWTKDYTFFVGILAFFLVLIFAHNFIVTGKPWNAPNHYDKRWERLGFRGDYTPLNGLSFMIARFFYLADWAPVLWVAGYLISLFYVRPQNPDHRLVQLAFLAPVAAYFFYYSWGGNQFGPRYYYEGFPFLTLALAGALRQAWLQNGEAARKFLLALFLASLVQAGFLFHKQTAFYGPAWFQRKQLYALAESTLERPSIVFIKGFLGDQLVLGEEDAVRNSPSLDAKVLYAHDLGEKNHLLMQAFPGRDFYRGTYDRGLKQAVLQKL